MGCLNVTGIRIQWCVTPNTPSRKIFLSKGTVLVEVDLDDIPRGTVMLVKRLLLALFNTEEDRLWKRREASRTGCLKDLIN